MSDGSTREFEGHDSHGPIAHLVYRHLGSTFPGAVIDIRHHGVPVYQKAFGSRQRFPSQKSMTQDTIFDLASLTKPLCTALLSLLVLEREGISLERSLGEILSGVHPDTGARSIGSLLTHTAGLPATPRLEQYFQDPEHANRDDAKRILRTIRPENAEGQEVLYSCTGFMLLGEILETITGERLDRLFTRLIADPLGLSQLSYRPLQREPHGSSEGMSGINDELLATTEYCPWRQRWLRGEVHDESAWVMGGVAGNAGLFGSSADVHTLVRELTERRSSLFDDAVIDLVTTSQTDGLNAHRTMGFELSSTDNSAGPHLSQRAFGHTGFTGTSLWIDPEADLVIAALTNRVHLSRNVTATPLMEFRRALNSLAVELWS